MHRMNRRQRRHHLDASPQLGVRVSTSIPWFRRELGQSCDLCGGPVTKEYPYLCQRCINFLANEQLAGRL
jgi:hypothetical protein